MPDGSLKQQLLKYFDQVIGAPDEEWRRPAYLEARKPTELFVAPILSQQPNRERHPPHSSLSDSTNLDNPDDYNFRSPDMACSGCDRFGA